MLSKKNFIHVLLLTFVTTFSTQAFAIATKQKRAIQCMAENVYHEARGESLRGKKAIAAVTMNRVKSDIYPDTVCSVVYQHGQFSWVRKKPKIKGKIPDEIYSIARQYVLSYSRKLDLTNGATSYHATYVSPRWKNLRRITKIGKHIFYEHKRAKISY